MRSATLVAIVAFFIATGASEADAAVFCQQDEFDEPHLRMLAHHDLASLSRDEAGTIYYDPSPARRGAPDPGPRQPCDGATVFNTDTIRVTGVQGTAQGVNIINTNGGFAPGDTKEAGSTGEIEIVVDLGGGTRYERDLLRVTDGATQDHLVLARAGINLNTEIEGGPSFDYDIVYEAPRPKSVEVFSGGGRDRLFVDDEENVPYNWLQLVGGAGRDRISGGFESGGRRPGERGCLDAFFTFAVTESDRYECLVGGGGNDDLEDWLGVSTFIGGSGDDEILAGREGDLVLAGSGQDHVEGESGNDRLFGQSGDDSLRGSSGRDLLNGGLHRDACNGGSGDDRFVSCERR